MEEINRIKLRIAGLSFSLLANISAGAYLLAGGPLPFDDSRGYVERTFDYDKDGNPDFIEKTGIIKNFTPEKLEDMCFESAEIPLYVPSDLYSVIWQDRGLEYSSLTYKTTKFSGERGMGPGRTQFDQPDINCKIYYELDKGSNGIIDIERTGKIVDSDGDGKYDNVFWNDSSKNQLALK